MDMGLKGKVAVVTEGDTAIGRSITQSLRDEGATVIVGGGEGDPRAFVADTIARHGRIDIVVSNAEGELVGTIDEIPAARVAALFERKVQRPWELARAVAPHMRKRGSGRIVVLVADTGKIPGKSVPGAAAVGAAQHAFVKSLSDDLGRDNVLVTGVSYGHVGVASADEARIERDVHVSRSLGQQEAHWAADVPLGRRGAPQDVANAIVFLASDRSSFISGSNLDVDGGDQRLIF